MKTLKKLRELWKRGKLLPILGSGLSIESRLPSWNGLIKNLIQYLLNEEKLSDFIEIADNDEDLSTFFAERFSTLSPIVSARYLKSIMKKPLEFSHAVYNALYNEIIDDPEPSDTMLSLTLLAKHSKIFLTYNFDNVLELAFSRKNIPTQSIYNQYLEILPSKTTVYHPHGYLPYGEEIVWDKQYINNEIILSEDDYHEQYLNSFNWSNITQVRCLYEKNAILFGLSANDPNLRRIFEIASNNTLKKHYIVLLREKSNKFSETWEKLQERIFRELGLEIIWINEYSEIQELIMKIIDV